MGMSLEGGLQKGTCPRREGFKNGHVPGGRASKMGMSGGPGNRGSCPATSARCGRPALDMSRVHGQDWAQSTHVHGPARKMGMSPEGKASKMGMSPRGTKKGGRPRGDGHLQATNCLASGSGLLEEHGQLVAGQLLAQSGKSLVRSKRACTGLGCSRLGGVAGGAGIALAGRCSCSVVGSVLGNLLLVCFPAGLGVSVLLLPGCALVLVAFKPLVGLRVEALRVLVVALFVVLCGHAVESRIEFGAVGVDALVGLLEGERDTAALEVDVDDLDEQLIPYGDNLLGQLNVAHGELGDVDQAFDAVFNANERAERNQLGDLTRNNLAEGVGAGEGLPRIFLRSLERQGDALAVQVDLENLDGDF